jgi:hypothetical protein
VQFYTVSAVYHTTCRVRTCCQVLLPLCNSSHFKWGCKALHAEHRIQAKQETQHLFLNASAPEPGVMLATEAGQVDVQDIVDRQVHVTLKSQPCRCYQLLTVHPECHMSPIQVSATAKYYSMQKQICRPSRLFALTTTAAVPISSPSASWFLFSFKSWRGQDRLGYIQQLESRAPLSKLALPGSQLPPNVQPSQLQVCDGSSIAHVGMC